MTSNLQSAETITRSRKCLPEDSIPCNQLEHLYSIYDLLNLDGLLRHLSLSHSSKKTAQALAIDGNCQCSIKPTSIFAIHKI